MTAFPTARRTALKPPEDVAGRLSSVTRNGAAFESYTFDSNDNRLTKTTTAGTTTCVYDDQDRLVSSSGLGGAQNWVHDANGDLVSRTDSTGTTSFDYETGGQLLSLTKPGGQVISYELDAGNKRAVKRVNGTVQRKWLYAGGLLPVAEFDANDNLVAVFNGGYMVKGGTTYRLLRDHLGSVRLVVDASTGVVAQRLSYGPWGEVLEDTNPGFQPFGYAGGLYDPDTGLVRFGARDYDPQIGRWTGKDPIGLNSGSNLYRYCRNDSLNWRDPSGLDEVFIGSGQELTMASDIIKSARSTTYDTEITSQEFEAAAESTTGLLVLAGHNYGDNGFWFYDGKVDLNKFAYKYKAKIVFLAACNTSTRFPKPPVGSKTTFIGFDVTIKQRNVALFARPFIENLDQGYTVRESVDRAVQTLEDRGWTSAARDVRAHLVIQGNANVRL